MQEVTVYLSRRNLNTLLSKLDRVKNGESSYCTLIKSDTTHPKYPSTTVTIVTAVEDEDYYEHRQPGPVYEKDV